MAQGALAQNITIYTIRILAVSLDEGALGTYLPISLGVVRSRRVG